MDIAVLAFGLVQLFIFVPPDLPDHTILKDSATNVLRRGFLFFVDIYVLYFVVSRYCSSRRALVETMGTFCLASAMMASVAVFEAEGLVAVLKWASYGAYSMFTDLNTAFTSFALVFFAPKHPPGTPFRSAIYWRLHSDFGYPSKPK